MQCDWEINVTSLIFGAPRMPPTPRRRFREVFAKIFRKRWRENFFRKTDLVDAINLVQKSSKSELSSRFLSRSKFWGAKKFEFLNGRLPPEDGSVRPQTLGKRVSDDPRHFIFRRRKKNLAKNFEKTGGGVQQPEEWSATTCGFARVSGLRWEGVGEGKHKLSHTRPQGVGGFRKCPNASECI